MKFSQIKKLMIFVILFSLVVGCGSSSKKTTEEQKSYIMNVSGNLVDSKSDAVVKDACIKLKEAGESSSSKSCLAQSNGEGEFAIKNLQLKEGMQIIVEKALYLTYYLNVDSESSGAILNTIFMVPINTWQSIPTTGGVLTSANRIDEEIKVEVAADTFNHEVNMSLTSMEGIEIPGKLPKVNDALYLPIGTAALYTQSEEEFNKPVKMIIPLPFNEEISNEDIMGSGAIFKFNRESGSWEKVTHDEIVVENGHAYFEITETGIYSLMIQGKDEEKVVNESELNNEAVAAGATVKKTITNKVEFPSNVTKSEENFLRSFAEKQYQTSFTKANTITIGMPLEEETPANTKMTAYYSKICLECGIRWIKKKITDKITVGKTPFTWTIEFDKSITIPVPYCKTIDCATN